MISDAHAIASTWNSLIPAEILLQSKQHDMLFASLQDWKKQLWLSREHLCSRNSQSQSMFHSSDSMKARQRPKDLGTWSHSMIAPGQLRRHTTDASTVVFGLLIVHPRRGWYRESGPASYAHKIKQTHGVCCSWQLDCARRQQHT